MPKRSSKAPGKSDANQNAFRVVQMATAEHDEQEESPEAPEPPADQQPEKNPAAVALGRLGGMKGGKARADALTPEQRSEIARKAAAARWENKGRAG